MPPLLGLPDRRPGARRRHRHRPGAAGRCDRAATSGSWWSAGGCCGSTARSARRHLLLHGRRAATRRPARRSGAAPGSTCAPPTAAAAPSATTRPAGATCVVGVAAGRPRGWSSTRTTGGCSGPARRASNCSPSTTGTRWSARPTSRSVIGARAGAATARAGPAPLSADGGRGARPATRRSCSSTRSRTGCIALDPRQPAVNCSTSRTSAEGARGRAGRPDHRRRTRHRVPPVRHGAGVRPARCRRHPGPGPVRATPGRPAATEAGAVPGPVRQDGDGNAGRWAAGAQR